MKECGKVYLVGAGCGDYDLITLRGLNLLKKCEVLVYDNLIDERLHDFIPSDAEKIFVGKSSGHHSESQENINKILIEKALEGKIVVRLKGGDPFVFGRGGEEITELKKHNIKYGIVPAVSSCIAVPELAGIPVTHRFLSRSFHVITGHIAEEFFPENMKKYALLDGTLIFLMGLGNIKIIAEGLISGGMKKDIPVKVISKGASAKQIVVSGSLNNIADIVEESKIKSPAVIVVGETASLDFSSNIKRPLDNISVSVTGTKRFMKKISQKLSETGAYVKKLQYMEVNEYRKNQAFECALKNLYKYNCIVFTSINGAEIFFKKLEKMKIDIRKLYNIKVAVIGNGTADSFIKRGVYPDIIPDKYTSQALAEKICESINNDDKLLILRAENGSEKLNEIFDARNIFYDDIKIYDIKSSQIINPERIDTDFLVFASKSGVDLFFENNYTVSEKVKIICIGNITASALLKYNINQFVIADTFNIDGILNKIIQEVVKNEKIQKTSC